MTRKKLNPFRDKLFFDLTSPFTSFQDHFQHDISNFVTLENIKNINSFRSSYWNDVGHDLTRYLAKLEIPNHCLKTTCDIMISTGDKTIFVSKTWKQIKGICQQDLLHENFFQPALTFLEFTKSFQMLNLLPEHLVLFITYKNGQCETRDLPISLIIRVVRFLYGVESIEFFNASDFENVMTDLLPRSLNNIIFCYL